MKKDFLIYMYMANKNTQRRRRRNARAGIRRAARRVPRGLRNVPGKLLVTKTQGNLILAGNAAGAAIAANAGAGNYNFKLSDVSDLVTLASQFDSYRINGIQLKFLPYANMANASAGTTGSLAMLYSYFDDTDASTPASYQEIWDRTNFKIHRCDKVWTEYFKPKPLEMVYRSSTTTGYGSGRSTFISCDYNDVQHFGWKWIMDNAIAGQQVRVLEKIYVEFRDPR